VTSGGETVCPIGECGEMHRKSGEIT
jgi:hypothetical protein